MSSATRIQVDVAPILTRLSLILILLAKVYADPCHPFIALSQLDFLSLSLSLRQFTFIMKGSLHRMRGLNLRCRGSIQLLQEGPRMLWLRRSFERQTACAKKRERERGSVCVCVRVRACMYVCVLRIFLFLNSSKAFSLSLFFEIERRLEHKFLQSQREREKILTFLLLDSPFYYSLLTLEHHWSALPVLRQLRLL